MWSTLLRRRTTQTHRHILQGVKDCCMLHPNTPTLIIKLSDMNWRMYLRTVNTHSVSTVHYRELVFLSADTQSLTSQKRVNVCDLFAARSWHAKKIKRCYSLLLSLMTSKYILMCRKYTLAFSNLKYSYTLKYHNILFHDTVSISIFYFPPILKRITRYLGLAANIGIGKKC